MRQLLQNYMGMFAIAIVALLVIGAIGVRIDRAQERHSPDGIPATPVLDGNAPNGLVDVQWLMQSRSEVDHIFDLSDLRQYEAGHIPGAIHIWWQDAMALHSANYGEPDSITMGPGSDPVFGRLNLHVPQDARIVLYDSNNSERASWLLWVMTINDFTDVHVLDGGLPAWIGVGGELTTDVEDNRDLDLVATPTWNEDVQVRREALLESLDDPNVRIVDTRSAEQYADTVNGTIREGRIPGSTNIRNADVMRENGTFKSPEELRAVFETHGISSENQVVVYSLFTVHSGNVWLAFNVAGYDNVSIYMEGFVSWAYKEELPLDTDPYPTHEIPATPEPESTPPSPTVIGSPAATPDDEGPTDLTGD